MTNIEFQSIKEWDIVRVDFDWLPRISIHGKGSVVIKNPEDNLWGDMYVVGKKDDGDIFQGWFPRENVTIISTTFPNEDYKLLKEKYNSLVKGLTDLLGKY